MLTLHDNLGSGNAYKVRLILSHLNRPFHRIEYDVTKGETRTPAYLALNPNGRVPALQFDDLDKLMQALANLPASDRERHIVIMSNGAFGGIYEKLPALLEAS